MPQYIITPWKRLSDLLEVKRELFRLDKQVKGSDSSEDSRRHAVGLVQAWTSRGKVPHAVQSTALLVDAQLHHEDNERCSAFSVQATYSAAFCRYAILLSICSEFAVSIASM